MEAAVPLDTAPGNLYTYVVVGGGIAGVSCVEQILEHDSNARILLVSSSSVVKEARSVTRLTKTLQDFIVVESSLKSFKDVHQSVDVIHDHVASLNIDNHTLKTLSGKEFRYNKLSICTGGRPRKASFCVDSPLVLGIRDTESVHNLAKRIENAKRVILIGNGGIATEFVHEVKGIEVIWVIKDDSISAHYVDAAAAEFFVQSRINNDNREEKAEPAESSNNPVKRQQYTLSSPELTDEKVEGCVEPGSALGPDWHRDLNLKGLLGKKNVEIIYKTECCDVILRGSDEQKEWPIYAMLSNSQILGADLIIFATGVLPNCDWVGGSLRQEEGKGIFVNASMQTSSNDVYAAGDVCHADWKWAKHWFQMRLWTQARQMGLIAGRSMYFSHLNTNVNHEKSEEGEEDEPDFCFEIFSHVTKFFGFKVVLLGLHNGQGLDASKQELALRCKNGVEFIKIITVNGRLQGAILIGETGLEETFENLILNQLDLSEIGGSNLLDPDVDIEDYFD